MATKFSDLEINVSGTKEIKGNKIEIFEVFNKSITIHHFKIVNSKYPKKGCEKRLDMQITFEGQLRLLWTTSLSLIRTIQEIPEEKFPIDTVIVRRESKRFDFT